MIPRVGIARLEVEGRRVKRDSSDVKEQPPACRERRLLRVNAAADPLFVLLSEHKGGKAIFVAERHLEDRRSPNEIRLKFCEVVGAFHPVRGAARNVLAVDVDEEGRHVWTNILEDMATDFGAGGDHREDGEARFRPATSLQRGGVWVSFG